MKALFTWLNRHLFLFIAFIGMVILVFLTLLLTKMADNAETAKQTAQNTNKIVRNQKKTLTAIKALALDSKDSSVRSEAIARCIAIIFAKYTRDGQPVIITDLDRCVTETLKNTQSSSTNTPQNTTSQSQNTNTTTKSSSPSSGGNDSGGGGTTPDNDGLMTPSVDVGPIHIPPIHIPSPL